MKSQYLLVLSVLISTGVVAIIVFFMSGHSPVLLSPKGLVAEKELALMIDVMLLMLIVTLAVFILAFVIAWRYRAGNTKAVYQPNWEHGAMNELVWWAIPIEIVLVLGALIFTSTHELDPSKALATPGAPLIIQVVALPSEWLFVYPDEKIATRNAIALPINRPVVFEITADAPMNSFWIPELGGQIYAMTGMSTTLNLVANQTGTFRGQSANYSGEGFASMTFDVDALSALDFEKWISGVRRSELALTREEYEIIRTSSEPPEPVYYGSVVPALYMNILMQFMPAARSMYNH